MTKTYGYDSDGNLTSDNGVTYAYDARDELTSDGTSTYAYTADGDLATSTGPGGTSTFASDAYGQQITDAASSYTWDGLGRLISAGQNGTSISLTYDGMTDQVASDSSASYSRDPAGQITGVSTAGGGRMLVLDDQHDDLSGMFTAAGTALAGSVTYDPWGQVLTQRVGLAVSCRLAQRRVPVARVRHAGYGRDLASLGMGPRLRPDHCGAVLPGRARCQACVMSEPEWVEVAWLGPEDHKSGMTEISDVLDSWLRERGLTRSGIRDDDIRVDLVYLGPERGACGTRIMIRATAVEN